MSLIQAFKARLHLIASNRCWQLTVHFTVFLLGALIPAIPRGQAEYRVYQYYVKTNGDLPQDPSAHLVTSTLDPVSYVSYHGGSSAITVDLLRTWICPGYTGLHRPVCKAPYERILENKIKTQQPKDGP